MEITRYVDFPNHILFLIFFLQCITKHSPVEAPQGVWGARRLIKRYINSDHKQILWFFFFYFNRSPRKTSTFFGCYLLFVKLFFLFDSIRPDALAKIRFMPEINGVFDYGSTFEWKSHAKFQLRSKRIELMVAQRCSERGPIYGWPRMGLPGKSESLSITGDGTACGAENTEYGLRILISECIRASKRRHNADLLVIQRILHFIRAGSCLFLCHLGSSFNYKIVWHLKFHF